MAEKTKYHVFTEVDTAGVKRYEPHTADVEAHSATDAIRSTVTASGVYVAIPSRSFTPTTVTIDTKTVVKIGDV